MSIANLDVQHMCRICLDSNKEIKFNIFTSLSHNDLLANLIIECANVEISADDNLPSHICSDCLDSLETLYEFRALISNSDELLRETFLPSKDEQAEEEEEEEDATNEMVVIVDESLEIDLKTEYLQEESEHLEIDYPNEREADVENQASDAVSEEFIDWQMCPSTETTATTTAVDENQPEITERTYCCMCKESFSDKQTAVEHFNVTHTSKFVSNHGMRKGIFECGLCFKKFLNYRLLKDHADQFKDCTTCTICGVDVVRATFLVHLKTHQPGPYKCDICSTLLKTESGLREHKLKLHGNQKIICTYEGCFKQFANKVYLQRHMQIHMPVRFKPKTCEKCKKQFVNQTILKKHMMIHTGEKPYKCDICGAQYTHNTDHRRHMWTHTGSPYSCTLCKRFFDRPSHLRKHKITCIVGKADVVKTEGN